MRQTEAMTGPVKLRERVNLTDNERQIFDLLIGAPKESNPKTQLRVAGGWVRDKVLTYYYSSSKVFILFSF